MNYKKNKGLITAYNGLTASEFAQVLKGVKNGK